ncbi:MAG: dockerin type I domain-containing protein [Oscillospiraceae bacterium]|nr:dockerin type I domain-containing protein [Oscillospiraceae bacterium]
MFETDSLDNYIWNVQGINLISRQINGEMFYCMYNAHADITRMVDENGELAEKYYYDEWGVETETLRYGDVTGDGEVNINDYSLMKRLILLSKSELTAEQKIVSDIDADGTVDKDDVNILKQILFGEMKHCPADTNKDGFINEKNNIKYAGYFYDAETGLYYLNARFYDPETARFIQQDSYSGNIFDPLSLNLYTYAQNNPISYYDPTGHSIKSLFKKAANTVKKVYNTVKATATVAKPVVKQAVKTAATVAVNTTVKKVTTPIANTIKAAANKTENQRVAFQTVLAVGKSVQSPLVNAWSNYAQGEYDTLAGQIDRFMQFSENPAQTIGNSVNYFLSDPLRNNPAADVAGYYKDVAIDYDMFKRRLNNWSNYRLNGGIDSSPEGLRLK